MRALPILSARRFRHPLIMGASLSVGLLLALTTGARAQGAAHLIRLKYATFDPLKGTPQVDPALRVVPTSLDEVGHYLVQFQGHVRPEWLNTLRGAGVTIEDYVPEDTFVVRTTARQAAALPSSYRFVRWTGMFHPAYKIDPAAMAQAQPEPLCAHTFTTTDRTVLARRMQQYGIHVIGGNDRVVEVNPSANLAVQLARTLEVKWVQPRPKHRLFNDRSAAIMGAAGSTGVRSRRLFGKGQIVCVCDSGLDTGDTTNLNADFKGRVVTGIPLGHQTWDDPMGHGTHVAGSVLGSGTNSGSNATLHSYDNSFAGLAPEASLIVQGLASDPATGALWGFPSSLYDLFLQPYGLGARVHTNSWGSVAAPGITGAYDSECSDVDQFVYGHDDLVVLFAAGNDGADAAPADGVIDLGTVTPPGTAKNIITVGASEGYRPPTENWGGVAKYQWAAMFPNPPLATDYTSDNIEGMAPFSSRGPCADGRTKPDVVAPGTNIISAWSRLAAQNDLSGWGDFAGNYSDSVPLSKYMYDGGTSMATPLTAGAATLVREYYVTKQNWQPSAALVKATLINGAHDMNPGQFGAGAGREIPGPRPNNVEGYGRVDLARTLFPTAPRRATWLDRPTPLQTGQSQQLPYNVASSNEPLSITLVWTDPPAMPGAAKALVNDLDLQVTAPDGTVLLGNGGTTPDTLNNVENIDVPRPQVGTYTVTVNATSVPVGAQSYALVLSSAGGPSSGRFRDITRPVVSIVQPAGGSTVTKSVTVQVQAYDDRGLDRVMLQVDNGPYLGTRYAAPFTFTWRTAGFSFGQHTLTAVAVDTSGNVQRDSITVYVR